MLLNKAGAGNVEMKSHLGFIYLSNKFDNIISFVELAELSIRNYIGPEILIIAQAHYDSDDYNVTEQTDPALIMLDNLVKKIQKPVAFEAYRNFAPSNDLTHSDKGRQMVSTETEKSPFEWMIERDNQNQIKMTNQFIDLLFVFLQDNSRPFRMWITETDYTSGLFLKYEGKYYYIVSDHTSGTFADDLEDGKLKECYTTHKIPDEWVTATEYLVDALVLQDNKIYKCLEAHTADVFAYDLGDELWILLDLYDASAILFEWTSSSAYTICNSLLVKNVREFNFIFDIGQSARLYFAMCPIMRQIQNDVIKPCFLEAKYSEILSQIQTNTLSAENASLVSLVQPALVYLTLGDALIRLAVEILPDAILQIFTSGFNLVNKATANKTDRIEVSQKLKEIGNDRLKNLQLELAKIAAENLGETYEVPDPTDRYDIEQKYFRP
jgi:hypothetical protein